MANLTLNQAKAKLEDRRKRRAFRAADDTEAVHNLLTVVGEKEQNSSCFGAAVSAVLVIGAVIAGVLA